MSEITERELTFGEKFVGLTFNHGEGEIGEKIHKIKTAFAGIVDLIEDSKPTLQPSYASNLIYGMAQRSCLAAQMAAVKFITWKD